MADNKKTKNYKVLKRNRRRKKASPGGRDVVFVCTEVLKEIWIHVDEVKHSGLITFVTKSGKEIRRRLVYTWFPQGIWKIKFSTDGNTPAQQSAEVVSAENVEKVLINRLAQLTKAKKIYLYQFLIEGSLPYDQMVECLNISARGREITVRVTYTVMGGTGEGDKIRHIPFSDDYLKALGNEGVARVYLILLEHFSGINVDERIALGGIDRREYRQIIKIKSKDKRLDPKTIARIVTRGAVEYANTGGDNWDSLTLMLETILYQFKRKNPLAVANQLEIGRGLYWFEKKKLREDFGIRQRGQSLLLYNKYGEAVQAFVGYMDLYYRNLDLDKVPALSIKISDPALADFLKILEQTFAFPTRETYVFLASLGEFYHFIVKEIHRIYGGEIEKRVMAMLPMAIGFFVVHAVIGAMARRGNIYAAALLAIAKAVGWIMNVDMGIATLKKMAEAGRHFAMMETIHRRSPKEKGKKKLTRLSKYHLYMGTKAMINGMAEIIAMGVFWAGGKLGQKSAQAFAKRLKLRASRKEARIEIFVENGKITKVRATKGTKTIEVQTQEVKALNGKPATGAAGKKGKIYDSPPLEESGPNLGRRQQARAPTRTRQVKLSEYRYKTTDSRNRPASSEEVCGMPERHLKMAIEVARQQGVMVIFRTTNPRGVQHILNGHPPKGKDLIALNADSVTGKVTARTSKQWRIATRKGYYVLGKNGYAYNKNGQRLTGPDGKPIKHDMNAKGKHGELTNRPGQVIDPKTRKAVVGDYDLQDVIRPGNTGQNMVLATSKGKMVSDFVAQDVGKFTKAFNSKLRATGDVQRIVHGADAQFLTYRRFRRSAFKGDAIGITPDGKVVHFTERGLGDFYKAINRSRLDATRPAPKPPQKGKPQLRLVK